MDTTAAVQAGRLGKTFRGAGDRRVTALDGVDLTVHRGEIVALLGPNGAGKTTLIDLVLGLTRPTTGTVEVFGGTPRQAVTGQHVGAVMQTGGLLPDMTVEATVKMIAATLTHPRPVAEVLEHAKLTDMRRQRVGRCSGGEQQRLRFALALLGDPGLLILDEPTTGMDPTNRHGFWESMRVQADRGVTVLFATHYLQEAQDFAQRIVLLDRGTVIADGTPAELRDGDVVVEYDLDGHHSVTTTDSDTLARDLLDRGASNLRITAQTLEDTFIRLTDHGSEQP
ncbi:ABC transporter ATP-binding protein [Corynebacterium sp.]|jgi:ABC-2 type transport system ATP-binding protein|uniref:ABC transporter ATP-binding protein n=1 Tax=Corynebacterium sp. TaxID=1720 RepID=UPI0025BA86BA|nr:ABC transporter ATP-binding protein [Corynebacterium sp.]